MWCIQCPSHIFFFNFPNTLSNTRQFFKVQSIVDILSSVDLMTSPSACLKKIHPSPIFASTYKYEHSSVEKRAVIGKSTHAHVSICTGLEFLSLKNNSYNHTPVLSHFVLSCLALPCPVPSHFVSSHLISHLISSHLISVLS